MEINPYRVLVQLIPGSLFIGIILVNEIGVLEIGRMGAGTLTLLALLSILIGYIFNGIGHFIEGFLKNSFESAIQKNLTDVTKGGRFVRFFRWFSIIRIEETIAKYELASQQKKQYNRESRTWSKEENKFARTLLVTSILLLIYIYGYPLNLISEQVRAYVRAMLWTLFIVSFYRYMVSSIDYSYKRRNKTT